LSPAVDSVATGAHPALTSTKGSVVLDLTLLGVPNSAGSFAPGQDQAPRVLRETGLVDALQARGITVTDLGDLSEQVWTPDPEQPTAQNLGQVVDSLVELRRRLRPVFSENRGKVLVLGGNCTVALGVLAAMTDVLPERPALLYIDRHLDMNIPDSTPDGALDWMGLGHALGVPGHVPELAAALGQTPLLKPDHLAVLGVDPRKVTTWEAEQARRLALHTIPSSELRTDPVGSTASCLDALPPGPLHVHVDVDVLDFTNAPIAEDTGGRNTGPRLDDLTTALQTAARDSRMIALSIGELNPARAAGAADALPRFVDALSRILAV